MNRDHTGSLTTGHRISHYEILEEVGFGGHGVVYRARNIHLDRIVALKTLAPWVSSDEKMVERLKREARTLSTLNHPNVAVVYDLDTAGDTDFLIMEYVPGQTLAEILVDGPIPEKALVHYARQLGEGLAAAHARGIVHRDLKPGNLKADADGQLKILDFGLAKKVARPGERMDESITGPQIIVGTLPYMAPEQLQGREADVRTDIYAFGCVLYEMATGSKLFPDANRDELSKAILGRRPQPPREVNPAVSTGLEKVIERALEKDPDRRYQKVSDLISDLPGRRRRPTPAQMFVSAGVLAAILWMLPKINDLVHQWFPPAPTPMRSLAVLPFEASQRGESGAYADQIHHELIANIGRQGGDSIRVVASSWVVPYRHSQLKPREIGRELDVDALVRGTVVRDTAGLRVMVELADARSGLWIWGDTYERQVPALFELLDDVAVDIVRRASGKAATSRTATATSRSDVDPAASDAYLQGRMLWNERTQVSNQRALERFKYAVEIAPGFAEAHAGIADAYGALAMESALRVRDAYPRVRAAALRALELDNSLPEAHASLGNFLQNFQWDWLGAEREFRRAIELNPSYPIAHQWLSLLLAQRGDFDPAIEEATLARALDRSSPVAGTVAACYYFARRYDEAIESGLAATRADPSYVDGYRVLAGAYVQKRMEAEAFGALEQSFLAAGDSAQARALRGIYDQAGLPGVVQAMVTGLMQRRGTELVSAVRIAELHVYLGAHEDALDWLDIAYADREVGLNRLKVDPLFDDLRGQPRFNGLLDKLEGDGMFQGAEPASPAKGLTAQIPLEPPR